MSKKLIFAGTLAILILFVGNIVKTELSRSQPAQPVQTPVITNDEVQSAVNEVRVQNGRKSLVDNSSLDASAMARAEFLCYHNEWSHDNWQQSVTYLYQKVGENLYYGDVRQTPRTIVQAWVNSPTHYANMLDPVYTEQGVGVFYCSQYQGQDRVVIVVNHFGMPR